MYGKAHVLDGVARRGGTLRAHKIEWPALYTEAWRVLDDWLFSELSEGKASRASSAALVDLPAYQTAI